MYLSFFKKIRIQGRVINSKLNILEKFDTIISYVSILEKIKTNT